MDLNYKFIKACETGNFNVVKGCLAKGADIHVLDDCALRWAAMNGHLEIVNYLRQMTDSTYKCYKCLIKSTCLELCEGFNNGFE